MENSQNKELFESMPVPEAVSTMAIPTIVGQLIVLIYSIADTFFIGQTNNPCMVAAASLILPVFNISLSISAITGVGGATLMSRLMGKGQSDEASKVYSFSVYLTILASAIFSLTVLIFMDPLLRTLGAGNDTFAFAKSYAMCVIVLGGIPTILTNVLSSFVRNIGESVKASFGITLGGVINIALDPIFMFVILPKGNEILGAGIATCLSNCIACVYFIVTIKKLNGTSILKLGPIKDFPQKSNIINIITVGTPSAINTFLFDLDYIVIDRLMAGYGDIALASMGIVLKAERLPLNIGIGICQGMVPIIAYNYASGNHKRMRETSRFSLLCGIICGLVSIALYEIFAPFIMRFFIADTATVALGTGFLRVRTIATIFMFLSFYHVYLFNSYGKGHYSLFLGVLRWAVLNIPMLFIFNAVFGMQGIVWAQVVSDVITVIISVLVHRGYIIKHESSLTD